MKIRVISDLHIDVNKGFPLNLPKVDKDVFTVIAGDTAGMVQEGIDWIRENEIKGVCVAGNHLVYNNYKRSVKDLKEWLKIEFPKGSDMTFLENDYVELDDKTILIGCTLYSNYEVEGQKKEWCMNNASRRMNDFRIGLIEDKDNNEDLRPLEPSDYVEMFEESKAYIEKVCNDNPNKNIIVVTHHAPSLQSIHTSYKGDLINSSFASDLDSFIKEHSNIKCWIHGHTHNNFDYMVGGCRVFCNPRGYCHQMEDVNWNPMTYIDTETWDVSTSEAWFSREMSEEEKENRKIIEDRYKLLFSIYC